MVRRPNIDEVLRTEHLVRWFIGQTMFALGYGTWCRDWQIDADAALGPRMRDFAAAQMRAAPFFL